MHPRVKYIVDIIQKWDQLEEPSLSREDWMLLVQDPKISNSHSIDIPLCESRGYIYFGAHRMGNMKVYISDTPNITTAIRFEDVEGGI